MVDREEDGGALLAHKSFWNYPTLLPVKKEKSGEALMVEFNTHLSAER